MNERIKLLAEQATTKEAYYPAGCNGYPEYRHDFDKEKFAELIVEECISQCWTVSELEHKGTVISECSKRMRKHFGVEA